MRIIEELTNTKVSGRTYPLVSIITPAHNSELFLEDAINSALAQTYKNWEMLIVVDTKSTDATLAIAQNASTQDSRIKVLQNEDCHSISFNRNFAIDNSLGEYIAFLDSDDRWLPEKLAKQVAAMENESANISYHSFRVIDVDGAKCGPTRRAKYSVGYKDLLKNNCMGCLTVMVRRSFIKDQRMEAIRHEDLHFWIKLLHDSNSLAIPVTTTLAEYRVRDQSISSNKIKSAFWRWCLYRKLEIPPAKAIYYLSLYSLLAAWKRI